MSSTSCMGTISSFDIGLSLQFLLGLFLDFRLFKNQTAPITARTMIPTATGAITLVATLSVPCCVDEVLLREELLGGVGLSKCLGLCVVVGEEKLEVEWNFSGVSGAEE